MTVLSLMVTILVQMASAAFSLRGKNLANALSLTFQTIDPKIGEHAHSLAAQILRDPIFSDSIWRNKSRLTIGPKAQLLIDAERKLRAAKQELAKTRQDAVKIQAVAKAEATLATARVGVKVPTVKPNRKKQWAFWSCPWGGGTQLGTAIRPGEIYRVLHDLDDMGEIEAAFHDIPPELVRHAASLISALRKQDQPSAESQAKLRLIAKVSELLPPSNSRRWWIRWPILARRWNALPPWPMTGFSAGLAVRKTAPSNGFECTCASSRSCLRS